MSKRSNWCEYDEDTRNYIKKRDNNKCIICGNKNMLQIMHIFVSRAKGGKGCKENGVLGCVRCHRIIDNPIGKMQNEKSKEYMAYCYQYLFNKEHITYNKEFRDSLKYNKQDHIERKNKSDKKENKCKDCIYLIKKNINNSTLPIYYCNKCKKITNKNKICDKFKKN